MTTIPLILLFSATVALGVFLGVQHLRQRRGKPMLIGAHILLGAAGLEAVASLLWAGAPDSPAHDVGTYAAGMLVAAMFIGLLSPLVGRRSRQTMTIALTTHASIAAAGFVTLLVWASLL